MVATGRGGGLIKADQRRVTAMRVLQLAELKMQVPLPGWRRPAQCAVRAARRRRECMQIQSALTAVQHQRKKGRAVQLYALAHAYGSATRCNLHFAVLRATAS